MADTPRNAPCPCGSGKKYKHCHATGIPDNNSLRIKLLLGAVAIAAAGGVIGNFSSFRNGILSAVAGLMVLGGWAILRDPPSSRKGGRADSIDFGRR